MVSGTLALKNGYYYAVLSYQDAAGKRHQKWVSTGLPQKGNKRRAEQELIRIRSEFEVPRVAGELSSNMLFADYLDQWLEIVRARIKPATFGSYQGMVKSTIGPYFRKKELTLKELEARHINIGTVMAAFNRRHFAVARDQCLKHLLNQCGFARTRMAGKSDNQHASSPLFIHLPMSRRPLTCTAIVAKQAASSVFRDDSDEKFFVFFKRKKAPQSKSLHEALRRRTNPPLFRVSG